MNNKDYGNIGEAHAITYYVKQGYLVSKPIFDNAKYDLIVDKNGKLERVQVKTSRFKLSNGKYKVNFRTMGGNRSGTGKVSKISSEYVDTIFIYLDDGREFEFDVSEFENRTCVNL